MIRSPSQTMTWDKCHFKWYLSRIKGVRDVAIGKRELAACVGKGVGAAMSLHFNHRDSWTPGQLVEVAQSVYDSELQVELDTGRSLIGLPEEVKYPELMPGMISAYFKKPCIPDDSTILGTEYKCGEDNNSYIDIWGENQRGYWVIDWKCKMKATPYQVTQELAKYKNSWQLGHYVWSLERLLKEWPKTAGIGLFVGEPTARFQYMEFEVDLGFMKWWEASARRLWAEMDAAEEWLDKHPHADVEEIREHLGMATDHRVDGFYRCEYDDLCFLYDGDPTLAGNLITVERR